MPWFSHWCAFFGLFMILLSKVPPLKHSPEVLSCIPNCRKGVIASCEKYMLGKLHLGMSYSDVGREFIVN